MIASEFPGLFSYNDLVSLDLRDEQFWFREALRKQLRNEKLLITSSLYGMADRDAIQRKQLQWQYQEYNLENNEE